MNTSDERWQPRLARIRDLQSDFPDVPALAFYELVLQFQSRVTELFRPQIRNCIPLRDQIDISALTSQVPVILKLSAEHGPELLRDKASQLSAEGEQKSQEILRTTLHSESAQPEAIDDFVARACLQPLAENLQLQSQREPHYNGSACPVCGGLPQMAALNPEGEGASRSLLCSLCLCEWPYRRVICPWCGEQDKERLPRYSSDEWPHVHIDGCDTCKHYLKTIDLSVNGLAVPLVDEAAVAVLDVWATERGYTKIIRNLIGF